MLRREVLSRRGFLGGGVVALAGAGVLAAGAVEYVGGTEFIDVFRTVAGRRRRLQRVPSERPTFVAIGHGGRFLFAVNEVAEYRGLPSGSVESYAIAPDSGQLSFIGRQALSLSATLPRHLAISPDGRHMVVAAFGGGLYNVLPIDENGVIGRVEQCIKEIGCSVHPERQTGAHPHSVVFHPSGRHVLSSDLGSDRLTVFDFDRGRLTRLQQFDVRPGSGPGDLQMDATGSRFVVRHCLRPGYSACRFERETGRISLHAEDSRHSFAS